MDSLRLPPVLTLNNSAEKVNLSRNESLMVTPRGGTEARELMGSGSIETLSPIKSMKHSRNKTIDGKL